MTPSTHHASSARRRAAPAPGGPLGRASTGEDRGSTGGSGVAAGTARTTGADDSRETSVSWYRTTAEASEDGSGFAAETGVRA